MSIHFVMGGRQRPSHLLTRDEWSAYSKAVLLRLDTDRDRVEVVLEHETAPDRGPPVSSHVFKAGSWDGPTLLLCTQTEVVVYDPLAGRIVRTISHPWFNDVHHVARLDGRLHVVSTGLDAVLVLDDDDRVVEVWPATGQDPFERFDRATDWRRVPTTKPHRAHPNFVSHQHGARWVTRFEQRDVVGPSLAVRLADDPVHDGIPVGDETWFTVVSGQVVRADLRRGVVTQRHLLPPDPAGRPLGWCRGIEVTDGGVLLGFSRLRPTTLKQNLAWLRAPLGKAPEPRPTRVARYDASCGREIGAWDLEDHLASVFAVLPGSPR